MAENDDVLSVNEAFYDAFGMADMQAMGVIWAHSAAVSCLHPGWNPIHGREEVLASWHRILSSPDRPQIECVDAHVRVDGIAATVICYEKLDTGYLIATNLFVQEEGFWRMTHHHASGLMPPSELD